MRLVSQSVNQTISIGKVIAGNIRSGDIICLCGELGSGKTVLAKGIAQGLGIHPETISSPSFVLVRQSLEGKVPLYHFDFYRLEEPRQILGLGYEEYLYDEGVSVIEWAERLGYLMPKEHLKVELSILSDTERSLMLSAQGSRYRRLLGAIDEDIRH